MKYLKVFYIIYLIAGCVAFLKGLFLKNEIVTLLGLVIIGIAGVSAAIKHLDNKISHNFINNSLKPINEKTSNITIKRD